MKISLITGCMNRESFLERSMKTWMILDVNEIIILDWSSKGDTQAVIDKYQDGRIYRVRVPDQKLYNVSKVTNTAIRFATGEAILRVDSDVLIFPEYTKDRKPDILYVSMEIMRSGNHPYSSTYGTCMLTKKMFEKVNGYNENVAGWGWEDTDFYRRMAEFYPIEEADYRLLYHLPHSNNLRTENYMLKNITISERINYIRAEKNKWTKENVMEKFEVEVTEPNGNTYKTIV